MSFTKTFDVSLESGTPATLTFPEQSASFLISNRSSNPVFLHLPIAGGGYDSVGILINANETDRKFTISVASIQLVAGLASTLTVTAILGPTVTTPLPEAVRGQLGNVNELSLKQWFCTVASSGGGDFPFSQRGYIEQTSGAQRSLVSDSADDAAAGTGARIVIVSYIDDAGDAQIEEVTLNGLTPVDMVATNLLHVNGIFIKTAGSVGQAVGNIDLKEQTAGAGGTIDGIAAGAIMAHTLRYVVPNGKEIVLDTWFLTGNTFAVNTRLKTTVEMMPGFPVFGEVAQAVFGLTGYRVNGFSNKLGAGQKFEMHWNPTAANQKGTILIRGWERDAA